MPCVERPPLFPPPYTRPPLLLLYPQFIHREAEDAVQGVTRDSLPPQSRGIAASPAYTALSIPGTTSSAPAKAGITGTVVPAIAMAETEGGGGSGGGGGSDGRGGGRGGGGSGGGGKLLLGGVNGSSIVQAPSNAKFPFAGRDTRRDGGGRDASSIASRLVSSSRFSVVRSLGRSWRRRGAGNGGDGVGGDDGQQSHTADFSAMVKAIEVSRGQVLRAR